MSTRQDDLFCAQTAKSAKRPRELVDAIKRVALLHAELTAQERDLLSVGYKDLVSGPRKSWRVVKTIEQNETAALRYDRATAARDYREIIERELEGVCDEVITLVQKHLLPNSTSQPYLVFLTKMKADYYRYLAEFKTGDARQEVIDAALAAYKYAGEIATECLPSTDPLRLGLALNTSVFFYEIMGDTERASRVARAAFDSAIFELDHLSDQHYRDTALILQLLRDNLGMWSTHVNDDSNSLIRHSQGSSDS